MHGILKSVIAIGLFSGSISALTVVTTTEMSRMEIHRGGAGAPETGPTEGNYITWFNSFGVVKRVYTTSFTSCPSRGSCFTSSYSSTVISEEPLDNMCAACGASAGYQLKIYSKQDPRVEKFDKPIVVVPGFDPDYGSSETSNTFDNFAGMMSLVYDGTGKVEVPDQNFLKELYDAGYDVVFIKFFHPNIDINANAKALEKAMIWLNLKSSTLSGDEPAILGASMGGLIARKMLQNAGNAQGTAGGPVKSGLFISFDAPNRGAEIPMSIQAMVRYIQSQDGTAEILNTNIGSIAAGQMLLSQRKNSIENYQTHAITNYEASGTTHGDFMINLNGAANTSAIKNIKSYNNTRPIRTVAISSGSKNGSAALRGLPAGENYMSEDYATLYYRVGFSNGSTSSTVFTGNAFSYSQWKYHLAEPAFAENLPGGNRDSYSQLHRVLTGADYESRNWTGEYPGHCFVPTASALGLTGIDINTPSGWLASAGAGMFDEIHSPELNQNHVAITMENKQWMLDALRRYGPHSNNIVGTIIAPLLLQ